MKLCPHHPLSLEFGEVTVEVASQSPAQTTFYLSHANGAIGGLQKCWTKQFEGYFLLGLIIR